MLKKFLAFLLIVSSFSLFPAEKIPFIIDFHSKEFRNHFFQEAYSPELIRSSPFNGAKEMSTFFQYLKNVYHIHTAVETGTFHGQTAMFFGALFETTHTIEISPENYSLSKAFLSNYPNVQIHLGNSSVVLREILPALQGERVVFYLDAHWNNYWPLLDELEEISKTHHDNCVIVVDDVQVIGRSDIGYDSYQGNACSYEYMKGQLGKVFSEYTIHYLIPRNVAQRAKLVAIPKAWTE